MPALAFEVAIADDDPELRQLLRENPIPGSIALSFEREPDYFAASPVEGPFHQTIIAREKDSQKIIALGSRSVRALFLEGRAQSIGYMSQLRVDPTYGKSLYLARGLAGGFKRYHELHQDGRAPFYLMSIIEDNLPARRLLTSNLAEYPFAKEYVRMFTYGIYPLRIKPELRLPHPLRLIRGNDEYASRIVDYLNQSGAKKQLAPFWTCDSLFAFNLSPSDFFLALDGEHIVGCLACWDQKHFKQTVVRGYSGGMARWRNLINLASRFRLAPYLPEPGTRLNHCYASHVAIDNDDPVVFSALLRALYNHAVERRYSYFTIGLAETNPLRSIVKSYRPITYISQLYFVGWESNIIEEVASISQNFVGVEIALL